MLYLGIDQHARQITVSVGDDSGDVRLSGDAAFGALGLDPQRSYYLYDFRNDRSVGKTSGSEMLRHRLRPGEARVLSVHAILERPQWIATDRHLMQGYVDLIERPAWDEKNSTFSGTSRLVQDEPYRAIVALNGREAISATASNGQAQLKPHADDPNLVVLELHSNQGGDSKWTIRLDKP